MRGLSTRRSPTATRSAQWRSVFSSEGRLSDNGPVNEGYRWVERARDKVKELMLEDGQLTYLKNGEKRTPRAPTSPTAG